MPSRAQCGPRGRSVSEADLHRGVVPRAPASIPAASVSLLAPASLLDHLPLGGAARELVYRSHHTP